MPPARVVRRATLMQRIQSNLNPSDLLLWIQEELNSQDWEEFDKQWSTVIGIGLNALFILARVNSVASMDGNDVFEDYYRKPSGLLVWFFSGISTLLTIFSIVNALYALFRTKAYRFFESEVRSRPKNPNLRRVKVENSPTSSPMRYLSTLMSPLDPPTNPGEEDEVWELTVWDPIPICLHLFVLFSPAHVWITTMFLPCRPLDPQPGVTIATTIMICFLLSMQGHYLSKQFSQQNKDSMTIYRGVSKEYDTKYVQPNAQKQPVRDVGIQFPHTRPIWNEARKEWTAVPEVVSSTPYSSPRGFRTRPNTVYAAFYNPAGSMSTEEEAERSARFVTPSLKSPIAQMPLTSRGYAADLSSPLNVAPASSTKRYASTGIGTGDSGSLGVFTHAASPLRKAASANLLRQNTDPEGRKREGSPSKRMSTPAGMLHQRLAKTRNGGSTQFG